MRRRHLTALLRGSSLFCLLALCGLACSDSSKLHPVQGKVMYKNQPLAGALVTFHPKGAKELKVERPVGLTKEDGTFTLKTGQNEGAPAGEYMVTIICSVPINKKAGKAMSLGAEEETTDVLGGAYADVSNSKLPITVNSGPNQLPPFDLK